MYLARAGDACGVRLLQQWERPGQPRRNVCTAGYRDRTSLHFVYRQPAGAHRRVRYLCQAQGSIPLHGTDPFQTAGRYAQVQTRRKESRASGHYLLTALRCRSGALWILSGEICPCDTESLHSPAKALEEALDPGLISFRL